MNHFLLEIDQYIASISAIVWLFPPIRQFRTKYFYFFLFLAILGPISRIIRQVFESNSNIHLIIFTVFTLLSLFEISRIKSKWHIVSLSLAFSLFLSYIKPIEFIDVTIIFFILLIISIVLLKRTIEYTISEKAINVFQVVLIFYFLTNITKFINVIFCFTDAPAYFSLTNIIQSIIAVFFCIFTVESSKMKIPLKSLQKLEI